MIGAEGFQHRRLDSLLGKGNLEQIDVCRFKEAADVLLEPEDRRALVVSAIAADALKDTESVVEGVVENVDLGVVPGNEVAVHPDFFASDRCHRCLSGPPGGEPEWGCAAGVPGASAEARS